MARKKKNINTVGFATMAAVTPAPPAPTRPKRVPVDASAFEGLNIEVAQTKANELREIEAKHGHDVMLGVAAGMSLDRALEVRGISYRPNAS